ncbi:WD40 repeat domain-containing protein [Reichenbachiella versicolor]|uniref:WD40 repeat domain-containing protein n=1 Tax=Reichenbachiella versicolor TaxID=1821036 RepID=UPI000D6E3DF1|nr:hypothetical protein [Reichenbachiella versicolor]
MVNIQKIHTYTGHKDAVYTLEQGLEDHTFFSSGGDGMIIEWDLNNHENGRLIAKVPTSVYALHLLKQRNTLIVGQNYEGIHLVDLKDRSEVGSVKLSDAAIFDIKVYENLIFVAGGKGELSVLDLNSLEVLKRSSIADSNLRSIYFTQSGKCLIGASEGQIIQIDIATLKIDLEIKAHETSVFALAQHSDVPFLLSGGRDARLKYWGVDTLKLEESINAHMYAINDIVFKQDGKNFATASMDKTIKIWDYEKRKLIKVIDKARHGGHLTSVNKLVWTKFNDYLLSCSDDRSISVWKIESN